MRLTACLTIGAALLCASLFCSEARAVDVTFQVHMAEQVQLGAFDPAQDFVDVAGSFNGWGSSPLTPLADADGDTVWSVVVAGFTTGQGIEFKFRLNGQWDGTEEFPGVGNNRSYTVLASGNLVDVTYNDYAPAGGGGSDPVAVGPTHWWNDTVFYEILVRSFSDSDGDGIGDLQGLTAKLDYLNDGNPATTTDLGITGIWLMPINNAPSYHGYDSLDYRSINPDYGTMADFEAFLAAAHARGIKVIIDYVMNHCSNEHPWFVAARQNSPTYRNWFRWAPTKPDETGPWGQGVWHWNQSGWYYGLFWSGMPDLNYDTPAVKTEMLDTAAWWLDAIGVDGFRLDAVLYIDEDPGLLQTTPATLQFWQDFNAHIKAVEPDALSVGEAWTASSTVVQYVSNDRLDLCFEFDLSYAILGAVNGGNAGGLGGKMAQVHALYPYLQYATFLTNHDQDRSFNVLGFDQGKAKAAAGLYLTLPGVPFLYYGEEIGMVGNGAHEYIRSPMQWATGAGAGFTTGTPWQAINANYPQFNVATAQQDTQSLLAWYKRLVHARNGSPALRRGNCAMLAVSEPAALAYVRADSQQVVLCLANTSAGALAGFTATATAAALAPGDYLAVDLLDPADTRTITVAADGLIDGLELGGHEVRAYALTGASAVDPRGGQLPRTGLLLEQNHPNPFNPSTTIRYALPEAGRARLGIYDVAGRELAVLLDGTLAAGAGEIRWDGTDARGLAVGAGVYFARLETDGGTRLAKMTLVK